LEVGIILLIIAGLFCALDTIFLAIQRQHIKRSKTLSQSLVLGGVLSVWGALILLLKYIFDNNFTYKYVMEHSSTTLSSEFKLSVLWVGQEGSLLLWTSLILLFYLIFRRIFSKHIEEISVHRSFVTASIICLAFIIFTIMSNPFASADEILQEGWGLNPLLRTFWNIVHPPTVFIGYAASVIPLSIVIARITQRSTVKNNFVNKKLSNFLNLQMAVIWICLTLGIIMGGYWAYVTLGWGGYWAWDPVETSSLIAWLFCTAYFHGRGLLESESLGANILIFLTYFSVIFATFITRSGVLSSVHGFAESPVAQGFMILMSGSLLIFVIFLGYQISWASLSLEGIWRKIKGSILMLALFSSLICIIGLTIVYSIGIIYPIIFSAIMGTQYDMDLTFFNTFSFPFALGLIISVIFCGFPNPKRNRTLINIAVGGGFVLGLLALFWGLPTNSPLTNLMLPLAALSLLVTGVRVIWDLYRTSKRRTLLRSTSHTILHFGLTLILLGVLVSSNTQSSTQGWYSIGSSTNLGSVTVELNDINVDYVNHYSYTIEGEISVFENSGLSGSGNSIYAVEPSWGAHYTVLIISNLWRDVYVSLHNIRLDPVTGMTLQAYLEVKVITLVSFVWAGCVITVLAISIILGSWGVRFLTYNPRLREKA
jgi:cytochrome c-type biogenesis protein CcmF